MRAPAVVALLSWSAIATITRCDCIASLVKRRKDYLVPPLLPRDDTRLCTGQAARDQRAAGGADSPAGMATWAGRQPVISVRRGPAQEREGAWQGRRGGACSAPFPRWHGVRASPARRPASTPSQQPASLGSTRAEGRHVNPLSFSGPPLVVAAATCHQYQPSPPLTPARPHHAHRCSDPRHHRQAAQATDSRPQRRPGRWYSRRVRLLVSARTPKGREMMEAPSPDTLVNHDAIGTECTCPPFKDVSCRAAGAHHLPLTDTPLAGDAYYAKAQQQQAE